MEGAVRRGRTHAVCIAALRPPPAPIAVSEGPSYPFHDRTALVTYCGRICIFKKKINLSASLAGQAVGIKKVDDGIWMVSFMDYALGYIDGDSGAGRWNHWRIRSVQKCYPCLRYVV